MISSTVSEQQLKDLAKSLTSFLSRYKHISDSYIIEFFTENLWETLPEGWQKALSDLTAPQIADLLLDNEIKSRIYPSVWPLSLLALRATAHTLAFPRTPSEYRTVEDKVGPEEFISNTSQSSLLGHIFRKHVKPKKQHEIRKLGKLVKQLCDQTQCSSVVDVGSGQGHLSRFLSFGLGLDVTGIEADSKLVSMASKFDGQLLLTLSKEKQKTGTSPLSAIGPAPQHVHGWVNPRATWEVFFQQLGKREKESESYPGSVAPCKKRLRVSVSGQGHVDESKLVHGSSHFCTDECSSVSDTDESQSISLLQKQDGSNSDCLAESVLVTIEPLSGTSLVSNSLCNEDFLNETPGGFVSNSGLGWTSPTTLGEVNSCTQGPKILDFVLTGLHACGDLSATLLRHFVNCPHVQGITSVACCYMKISTKENPNPPGLFPSPLSGISQEPTQSDYGYPMSEWVRGLPGHELSYKAREGACHAMEDYLRRLREESGLLKTHCYRAALESIIRAERPHLCRAGIQTIKKAHCLSFSEYAHLGLPRVGLPADLPFDQGCVEGMLEQQGKVVVYFSLALLLAPVVETLVLLDRMLYLQERGFQSQLVPLFDPALSPRNFVLVAVKLKADGKEGH